MKNSLLNSYRKEAATVTSGRFSRLRPSAPYAFLHHTIDITGFANDIQGYVPVPEMCYMETVWLDR
jgi:hypothetical protein